MIGRDQYFCRSFFIVIFLYIDILWFLIICIGVISMFSASMFRERFELVDLHKEHRGEDEAVQSLALSNRIAFPLDGRKPEESQFLVVIRAQSMHGTARMAGRLVQELMPQSDSTEVILDIDWAKAWEKARSHYEREHNPSAWCAVYMNGEPVFQDGEYDPLLDAIERCSASNKNEYDQAVEIVEYAFWEYGKAVRLQKQSVPALTIRRERDDALRCSLIIRAMRQTSTFNVTMRPPIVEGQRKGHVTAHGALHICASFLESIQLAYQIGRLNTEVRQFKLGPSSEKAHQAENAHNQMLLLKDELEEYETLYDIVYRPDKPDLHRIIRETENTIIL
ncbi:hypothetical protein [Tropicimonas aquimaris]|uniref:DUF4375 domain-containing protein n=1 Tax=Tropicimonas aquimaris TaxID=914152 RepID=A0ABW3IQC5_9RHOB